MSGFSSIARMYGIDPPVRNLARGVCAQGSQMWDSQKQGLLWRWWNSRVGTYLDMETRGYCRYYIAKDILHVLGTRVPAPACQEGADVAVEPGLVPAAQPVHAGPVHLRLRDELARHDDGGVPVMSSCCHAVILSRCHLVKAIPSTLSLSASASVWAEKHSMVSSRLQQGP